MKAVCQHGFDVVAGYLSFPWITSIKCPNSIRNIIANSS